VAETAQKAGLISAPGFAKRGQLWARRAHPGRGRAPERVSLRTPPPGSKKFRGGAKRPQAEVGRRIYPHGSFGEGWKNFIKPLDFLLGQ